MTQIEKFINTPLSFNLSGTLSSGATTLTPPSYSGWPASGQFRLKIDSEIMLVTNAATHPWPLARGQEGTSAASHAAGVVVYPPLTAGALAHLVAVEQAGTLNAIGQVLNFSSGVVVTQESDGVVGLAVGGSFGGEVSGTELTATGLTGAASSVSLVGGRASGAPTTGTFTARDVVITTDGAIWVCTVGGTPGTWVQVGGGGGSGADLTTAIEEYDDFLSGAITSGSIGKLGWSAYLLNVTPVNPSDGVSGDGGPGILELDTNSLANTCSLQMQPQFGYVTRGDSLFDLTLNVRPFGADGTIILRFGLMDDPTSSPPARGAYFEKLMGDTSYFGVTNEASTVTRTASLTTDPNDGLCHRLRVRRIDGTHVGFTVDGGTEVQLTTNLPTGACNVGLQIVSSDTNFHGFDIDYSWLKVTGLSR